MSDRLGSWAPLGVGVALAAPVLFFRYPPMGDLAFHESLVSILVHFGDTRLFPSGLYVTRLGQPNQLFHFLACGLSLALPTDVACKLVVAGSVLLAPVATARLADHFGKSRWSAPLVAPLMLGWLFRWGLVANLVGFVTLLFCLPALDRLAKDPTPQRAFTTTLLTVALYLGHESTMVLFAFASVVFAVQTPRRVKALALVACPGAAATLLAGVFAARAESLNAASMKTIASVTMPLLDKLASVPRTLFSADDASLFLFLGVLLAAFGLRVGSGPLVTKRLALADARLALVALVSFVLYLAMPLTWAGSTLVHQRFLAPAFALAVVCLVPRARDPLPGWSPLVAGFPLAIIGLTLPAFVQEDRTYRDLDEILRAMQDGSAVAQLDLDPRGPSVVAPIVGAAARALAVHGGRLLFSFTDASYTPVGMVPEREWNEPVLRLANTPYAFMPAHDLRRFRYVLVSLTEPRLRDAVVSAFAPEARWVATEGKWLLFESTLPLASLTAPDALLPSPPPESLAERVKRGGRPWVHE